MLRLNFDHASSNAHFLYGAPANPFLNSDTVTFRTRSRNKQNMLCVTVVEQAFSMYVVAMYSKPLKGRKHQISATGFSSIFLPRTGKFGTFWIVDREVLCCSHIEMGWSVKDRNSRSFPLGSMFPNNIYFGLKVIPIEVLWGQCKN